MAGTSELDERELDVKPEEEQWSGTLQWIAQRIQAGSTAKHVVDLGKLRVSGTSARRVHNNSGTLWRQQAAKHVDPRPSPTAATACQRHLILPHLSAPRRNSSDSCCHLSNNSHLTLHLPIPVRPSAILPLAPY